MSGRNALLPGNANRGVTACPYIEESVGSLHDDSFGDIWASSTVFRQLRAPKLSGKCGECEFQVMCGGCRARPLASHGDLFGEDELCDYTPQGGTVIQPLAVNEARPLVWDQDATSRLEKLPFFLQKMIRNKVEETARNQHLNRVSLAFMDQLRDKRFGHGMPAFPFRKKMGSNL